MRHLLALGIAAAYASAFGAPLHTSLIVASTIRAKPSQRLAEQPVGVEVVPDEWIVTFEDGFKNAPPVPDDGGGRLRKSDVSPSDVPLDPAHRIINPLALSIANSLCQKYRAYPLEIFTAFGIFHAKMSKDQAKAMSEDPRVKSVEPTVIGGACTPQSASGPLYSLDRIDQRS